MNFLLKKSKENRDALKLLTKQKCYAPAAHCGYYSCIQKFIYVLEEYYPTEYNEAKQNQIAISGNLGNLHDLYIREFCSKLVSEFDDKNGNIIASVDIKRMVGLLKTYRREADYKNKDITLEQIDTIVHYTEKVHALIYNYMQL